VYGYATLDIRLTKFPSPPRAAGVGGKTAKTAGATSRATAEYDVESVPRAGGKTAKTAGATSRAAAVYDAESLPRAARVGGKTTASTGSTNGK